MFLEVWGHFEKDLNNKSVSTFRKHITEYYLILTVQYTEYGSIIICGF